MRSPTGVESFTSRWHRSTHLLGYVLIGGMALRRIRELEGAFSIGLALGLLGGFTVLYASQHFLSQRCRQYPRLYFLVQMLIVQILGIFEVYMDTWAVLYIVLGLQVAVSCSRTEAWAWWGLFTASILGTLFFEFGFLSGLGRGLAYIVIGIFFILFDNQYAQREEARAESQVLLDELRRAHQKLQEQAARAERLAALQERARLTQAIHDAVGQKVFAIQLLAEATGALLEKDPRRAVEQLDLLQEQTQAALGQMRQWIEHWRGTSPPAPAEPVEECGQTHR